MIEIELPTAQGPKTFTLRPTFRTIARVENRLGAGILPLAARLAGNRFGAVDVAVILDETIVEPERPTYDEIGTAVLSAGVTSFAMPVNALLLMVLNGTDRAAVVAPGDPAREG